MWLDEQPESKLKDWIKRTKTPMLASMPDGEILWCNGAFETMLGWSSVELVGKKSWKDLTESDDLGFDMALVSQAIAGERTDYQLQKEYKTKNGSPKRVIIDVLRYPQHGEFDCFLVAACPLDNGVQFALTQIGEIRTLLIEMMERQPTGLTLDKAIAFAKEHPIAAAILATVFGVLLFGERVVEIIKLFGIKVGE